MADRNTRNRHERRHRYGAQDYDSPNYRQQEQFSTGGAERDNDHGQTYRQMGESAYGRNDYRQPDSTYFGDWDRQERYPQGDRGYARGHREHGTSATSGYGPARVEGPGRSFASFTSEDYGGRDFSAPPRPSGYGYAGSAAAARYEQDEDRGFLERAGDRIASWFGEDDGEDHTGRGPQNYTRSDERILEDVCDNLTDDWAVDARNIQVTVDKGEVTLDGTVGSREEKRRAEDCVDSISGVGHVQNNLRVQERSNWSRDRDDRNITAEQPASKT